MEGISVLRSTRLYTMKPFAPSGFFGHFGKYNDRNDDI